MVLDPVNADTDNLGAAFGPFIGKLRDEGRTIFLVEQNAHMALKYADKFFLLEQGEVTFSGAPGEVDESEVLQRAYLGARKAS